MTTSPVMSLTDELLAELEEACREHQQGFMIETSEVLALLRERAEMQQQLRAAMISVDNCELFRKDAERYQWLRELASGYPEDFEVVASAAFSAAYGCGHNFDLNIDRSHAGAKAMNAQALKHPRTQWEIEAAMWRAIRYSGEYGVGFARADSASGNLIAIIAHNRNAIPAFSFHRSGQDITAQVLAVLRGEK